MKLLQPIILFLLLTSLFSCHEEVKRTFPPVKVAVNDTNEIEIADSIYYILSDTLSNKITLSTGITNAKLVYSINKRGFSVVPHETVSLQKEDSIFQFYFTKDGFENSEVKTILLQKHPQRFLDGLETPGRILESHLNITMEDKSRGMVKVEIYNMMGGRKLQGYHFKNSDLLTIVYNWEDFSSGMYLMVVSYGADRKIFKVIK